MGSELFAGEQIGSLNAGTRLWDPSAELSDVPYITQKIRALACNQNGNSIYNIYAGNENYGARSTYRYLYNKLQEYYGSSGQYIIEFFPYDWRMSCEDAANALDEYITNHGYNSVVLIAHSMGGIVASKFMSKGASQSNKVDKLITLGTPFLGAPVALDIYLNGQSFGVLADLAGVTDATKEIVPCLRSVYELLPTKKWFDLTNQKVCTYSYIYAGSPPSEPCVAQTYDETRNRLYNTNFSPSFIHLLNAAENMHESLYNGYISQIEKCYYIVGTNMSTVSSIENVIVSYGDYTSSNEFIKTNCGDGTVPSWSADFGGINPDRTYYAINRDHTGAIENGEIIREGLTVSENVITKIKNIIDGNPDITVSGITKSSPVYTTNGWVNGLNDTYIALTFDRSSEICILDSNNNVIYSSSKTEFVNQKNINVKLSDEKIKVTLYDDATVNIIADHVDIQTSTYEMGQLMNTKNLSVHNNLSICTNK